MPVFLSRTRDALMGLAVDDAVGTTSEFRWTGTFDPIMDMVGGGPFLPKSGQWTDGTSMALYTADSLLTRGRHGSFDVIDCYQCWFPEGYRSSTDRCFDIGGQVRAALFGFEHDPRVPVIAERTASAGNNVITRLAPMVIAGFHSRPPREVVATTCLSARKAHSSVETEAATEIFATLLVGALLGWSPEQLTDVSWVLTGQPFDEVAARVISPDSRVRAPWEAETGGYIVNGLHLTVYGLLDFPSFKDATLAIANMGGDSDTNAAIYGQLDDTFYGIEAIPASWRECVYQGEEIDELACALMDLQLEASVARFGEDLQDEASSA